MQILSLYSFYQWIKAHGTFFLEFHNKEALQGHYPSYQDLLAFHNKEVGSKDRTHEHPGQGKYSKSVRLQI